MPFRLWQPNMLFAVGLTNFKIFLLKILRLGAFFFFFVSLGSILFHSIMTDGKKVFFEEALFNFEMRNIIYVPRRVSGDNTEKIWAHRFFAK